MVGYLQYALDGKRVWAGKLMRLFIMHFFTSMLFASPVFAGNIYVSTIGNDNWSGSLAQVNDYQNDGPFLTLEKARDTVRELKKNGKIPDDGITIHIRGGIYYLSGTFNLTSEDSGTEALPIIYQAYNGENVQLSGGKIINNFKHVKDPEILERLDKNARDKVMVADLFAQEIYNLGEISQDTEQKKSSPGLELFFNNKPMVLARWPNKGYTKISEVLNIDTFKSNHKIIDRVGKFIYEGERPSRWIKNKDGWLSGYWSNDWSEQKQKIDYIDTDQHIISLSKPYHKYGYVKGQLYYAFSILEELDSLGEWYLDRENGKLYFWPPSKIQENNAVVSINDNILNTHNTSNIKFSDIKFEDVRGTAININGGKNIIIEKCTIRNTGSWGASITNAKNSGISNCNIYNNGDGGIYLSGGKRKTLEKSNLYAENNNIHNYSRWNYVYMPGISINGVGIRVSYNLIHEAPHIGIFFSGNDNIIEFNEIFNVVKSSNDAGAIYAGRDWTMRGNIIRYNYLHDIYGFDNKGAVGIYLDDQFSGTSIFGNVFSKIYKPILIGGGRDNYIENNIFIKFDKGIHFDARGLGKTLDNSAELQKKLKNVPYTNSLWAKRYPELVNILNDEPLAPKGNHIRNNLFVGKKWSFFEEKAKPFLSLEKNIINENPEFIDAANGNFQLPLDSPILMNGFKQIPLRH